jgi:transcriptional regulator GlxA family with amidase domain
MRIAILNYEDAVPSSVAGPADILTRLNNIYPLAKGAPLPVRFEIDIVTDEGGQLWRNAFGEKKMLRLDKEQVYDLVIVPAMVTSKIEAVLARGERMIKWLQQQYAQKAELASICVGAFLLAATGLLDGKKATTHWMFACQFRKMYPAVTMEEDKIIIEQGTIYTCGGAFSFTTFMMYLAEKFCGHEVAILASKILMINMHQQPQSTFAVLQLQRGHADEVIRQVQGLIEKDYQRTISVDEMAEHCHMSVRNFIRRFEQATAHTPLEYLQRVRVENAKKLLESKNDSIEQVALQCGYEDMSFFRKVFKRHVAMTPREYKDKYGTRADTILA